MAYSWKKGKIIHDEETSVKKRQRSKKFELIIFGDSITKRVDLFFIGKSGKS